nr:isocitrate/isopropylmalate family dehydrogenase [Burkholderia ubonensis]
MSRKYIVAVIPGDGIGVEVMPEALRTLDAASERFGFSLEYRHIPWWDERAADVATQYPDVEWAKQHIDILCARFVLQPDRFDAVVASNLFGDILSDLGPACTGTIGIAPSANLNPEHAFPSLFEPVHGSAPDIAGKSVANPIGMIWSAALMLDFFGEREAHDAIVEAIQSVIVEGPRTADLGGNASTQTTGGAIASQVQGSGVHP